MIGLSSGPAGAVTNPFPQTSPIPTAISYESDCTTALQAGEVAPFISSTVINTTTDTVLPVGGTFGIAGVVSQTLIGPVIAGLNSSPLGLPATIGLGVTENFGSVDGHASGTFNYTQTFTPVTNPGGLVSGVTFASGATTLSGNFAGVPAGAALNGTNIPADAVTTGAGTGSGIGISDATTAANTGTGEKVGWAPLAGLTFTDFAVASGPADFTSAGTSGGTAGIGINSTVEFDVVTPSVTIPFGGASGVGAANCLETGWTSVPAPGPAQTGAATPQLPPGTTTPLVTTAPTFEPGAFVNLVQPITASNSSTTLGTGATKTIPLLASPATGKALTGCTLVPGSISDPRLAVTISGTTSCSALLVDSGLGSATVTFQFTATDTTPSTSSAATVTVSIGVPPVDQEIDQQVTGGLLQVSCSAPGSAGYPALNCPLITLTPITLDGQTQVQTTPANTIFVSDNRGDPASGWSLTTYMVPTPGNTNATCASAKDFCNEDVAGHAADPNGQIPASDLAISAPTWSVVDSSNPAPATGTPGNYGTTQPLGSLAATHSGGTFAVNFNYTLTIPASVYAGLYKGTVEFLVA